MKNLLLLTVFVLISGMSVLAQDSPAKPEKKWNFGADMNAYFYKNDFEALPVFRADRNKLHLEARYNYEDLNTFSGWIGYNFSGGNEFEYFITPMIGGVTGQKNGIAPGLEFTFGYKGFELYNEAEYMFDVNANENNFFYTWTDFTYSPKDWLWVGLSSQCTQEVQDKLSFEGGLLVGVGYKSLELTGYVYNPGSDNTFVLLTLSASF
jgi:hypothetical protein